MVDTLSPEGRSRLMSKIKGSNTKPELVVRSLLHRLGFRFRLHRRDLPGTPDIVLPKHQAVIFVNGCFWHRHTCKAGHVPKSRESYWAPKLDKTQSRDARNQAELVAQGWRVKVIWECEVTEIEALTQTIREFLHPTVVTPMVSEASKNMGG